MEKKIIIITKTSDRFHQIKNSLVKLSDGFFEIKNNYFHVETLIKFKRKDFLQIFFCIPDLLIIDQDIVGGKIIEYKVEESVSLLKKIIGLNVINKNTKILVLINKESEKEMKGLDFFIFTQGAKAEYFVEKLYEKIKEIFLR